ncbi:hypothetical protein HNR59_001734 [Aquamicrobium lusatiense]|uniref:Transmembrane anchor protein n=1 Tax=Aquamicrobium lusatiense TaxID=89772 RepID=A0A7W9S2Y8_9HYPH|nr:hypothetical protein [Aquamicrobium lusatiense]MBB6012389.1 hypothetical protein [Aquamicrobium lusatiense]
MYNTDLPRRAELPTSAQLKRSTSIAGITATALLAFVVLPSEYAVDPTGIGRVLGLTQMGEIKVQLATEAELDAASAGASAPSLSESQILARLDRIETLLADVGAAQPASPEEVPEPASTVAAVPAPMVAPAPQVTEGQPASPEWQDEVSFTLAPGEGAEFKLVMDQGAQAEFFWTANGAVVNYDTHGDGGGQSVSYEKGRGVGEQEGVLEAAFTGNHGWFWRNRTSEPLTITLRTRGAYSELKRMI